MLWELLYWAALSTLMWIIASEGLRQDANEWLAKRSLYFLQRNAGYVHVHVHWASCLRYCPQGSKDHELAICRPNGVFSMSWWCYALV
jgi:hypothetical protein